ncbi:TetR/AcrR family transcriptional regulator [Brevibacterium casei]|uniref:TetR/AcrR family transcriptional regulator n=1 Tax=Brevibacterium casei TaxID=33889 RepID=UPI003F7DB09F
MSAEPEEAGRTHMRAEDRRDLLVQAALRVMKRDGIRAATTRAICAEADMPHGAFHYCFRSKRELYAALLATDINTDLDQAWAQMGGTADVRASIHALLEAYWRTVEVDPEAQIVLTELTTLALRDPELRELPEWEQRAYRERVVAHLERFADRAGVTYTIPASLLADMILAALSGITTSWLSERDDAAARQTISEFANAFTTYTQQKD